MGYRSDLTIKCTIDVVDQIYAAITSVGFTPDEATHDDKYGYFKLYGYKWYDGYLDVDKINKLIYELGDDDKATMIREGEDHGDVETYGAASYALDLTYYVDVSYENDTGDKQLKHYIEKKYPELLI